MRRLYAAILLLPLFALLFGAIRVPEICPKAKESQCPVMAKMHSKCRMAMATQKCSRSAQKGKNEEKGKSGCTYCIDCPLCCLVTFKPIFQWEFTRQVTIIDYTVMSDNNLSDYSQQHWKPPDPSFLS
jgi:hypothetical protein